VFAGKDVLVDGDPNIQNEISLTLRPGNPNDLIMAYNDNPGVGPLGIAYSPNDGNTWSTTQLPLPNTPAPPNGPLPPNQMPAAFDPTITADTNGDVYAGFIAVGAHQNAGGWSDSGLYVCKSTDGGQNWGAPVQVSYDWPSLPSPPAPPDANYRFNDRCQITADTFTSSSYRDYLYIAWIKDRGWYANDGINRPLGDIYFSRSTDNGQTFSTPMIINDQNNHDMGNMPIPVVACDGDVYVTWMDYNVWGDPNGEIYIRRSSDGGQTFPAWGGGDHHVITIDLPGWQNSPPFEVTGAVPGANTLAKGAPVSAASPTDPNELYLVYAADPNTSDPNNEADIFFIKSIDGGQNWSPPLRVNDDPNKSDQIIPWIDVKPDGTIDVAWYDRRNDSNDTFWDVYIARSVNGGKSFSQNAQLNDQSFMAPSGWIGEYLGLAVDANDAYVAFTSDSNNGDVYFDKIPNTDMTVSGDFEPDEDVDLHDFAVFAAAWLSDPGDSNWNPVCNISNPKDSIVDYYDLRVFVSNWLYGR
jgi:hypothetical protein